MGQWTQGSDPLRINILMTLCIVLFDMPEIRSLLHTIHIPIQVLDVSMNALVVMSNCSNIQLEVLDIV
jgi:hypothetical protein